MLVSTVGEVDSRFLLTHAAAPHMNGIHRAIGMLSDESRLVLENLHNTILTRNGAPLNVNMVVGDCGILGQSTSIDVGSGTESHPSKSATASG